MPEGVRKAEQIEFAMSDTQQGGQLEGMTQQMDTRFQQVFEQQENMRAEMNTTAKQVAEQQDRTSEQFQQLSEQQQDMREEMAKQVAELQVKMGEQMEFMKEFVKQQEQQMKKLFELTKLFSMAIHSRLIIAAIVHSVFGCIGHYFEGVFNLLSVQTKTFINQSFYFNYGTPLTCYQTTWAYSVLSSTNLLGCITCYPLLSYSMEKFGRKGSIVFIKNILFITGSLMCFISVYCNRFELLFLGATLAGAASLFNPFHSVYLNECALVQSRGFVSTLPPIGFQCWLVAGMAIGLPQLLGTEKSWNFVFLIPAISATIHLITGAFLPESPSHLYLTQNDIDKATESLQFYHGNHVNTVNILNDYDREREQNAIQTRIGIREILKTKYLRWPFMLSFCILWLPLTDGVCALVRFSTTLLSEMCSENDAALYTVLVINLPCILIMVLSMRLTSSMGRRPILLVGLLACIIGTVIVAASTHTAPFVAVIGLLLVNAGHFFGPAIMQGFLSAELCPQSSRSVTVAFSLMMQSCSSFVVFSIFGSMMEQFGNKIMLFFTILSSMSFLFLFKYLPETRNIPVAQIVEKWLPNKADERSPLLESRC